jgi:DNA-binding CsgD family transcriptional regulator
LKEHDREQLLVLFSLEQGEGYLARAALAVARLSGGVGARARRGSEVIEAGAAAPHEFHLQIDGCDLWVRSDEPLDPEAERLVAFGMALLTRGLSTLARLDQSPRELERRLDRTSLGPRERELAKLVLSGASTKEIAAQMQLTESSVRTYVKRILGKVGVRSRLQLSAHLKAL